ncbi:MAG: hypothetical protein ACREUL_18600 [Steroidobacteraceae bacterium]
MRLFPEVLFTPSAGTVSLNTTEAALAYDMPAYDADNLDTTITNGAISTIYVNFGAVSAQPGTPVPPNTTILLQHTDGAYGAAASTATTIAVKGRSAVTVTRGTATAQQIFANR